MSDLNNTDGHEDQSFSFFLSIIAITVCVPNDYDDDDDDNVLTN